LIGSAKTQSWHEQHGVLCMGHLYSIIRSQKALTEKAAYTVCWSWFCHFQINWTCAESHLHKISWL